MLKVMTKETPISEGSTASEHSMRLRLYCEKSALVQTNRAKFFIIFHQRCSVLFDKAKVKTWMGKDSTWLFVIKLATLYLGLLIGHCYQVIK